MPSPVFGSKAFLQIVEKLEKKCSAEKKLPTKDVNALYRIISSTKNYQTAKPLSSSATLSTNALIREKTFAALDRLMKTLGSNSAFLKSINLPKDELDEDVNAEIEEALTKLARYVNEQKKESNKIARKDPDAMPKGS